MGSNKKIFALLFVLMFLFVGCGKDYNEVKAKDVEQLFTIIISKNAKGEYTAQSEVISEKEINIQNDMSLMEYLRDNYEVLERGGLIYYIEGIENKFPLKKPEMTDEQKKNNILGVDWFIYVNDKKTKIGASEIIPQEGDTIVLDFHEWDKNELKSTD